MVAAAREGSGDLPGSYASHHLRQLPFLRALPSRNLGSTICGRSSSATQRGQIVTELMDAVAVADQCAL